MLNTKDFKGKSKQVIKEIEESTNNTPDNDFSGFYTALVPYADMMTLLLIFFVFYFVIGDTETGWKTIAEEQKKQLEAAQTIVDSLENKLDGDINEKVISVPGEILFESGEAELRWLSHDTLMKIAIEIKNVIKDDDNWQIRIEGHTDNVPIANNKYASNWELSTARALSIVKFFIRNGYFTADQLQIMGYGEFKPLVANDSEENRYKNRRVEIKISQRK